MEDHRCETCQGGDYPLTLSLPHTEGSDDVFYITSKTECERASEWYPLWSKVQYSYKVVKIILRCTVP